jgi:cytochrome P450
VQNNQQIIALIGSANRDETVFVDPDVFDITRQNNPHLAFGFGIHNCFGRLLAVTEARLAILALINSGFNFELYECTPHWKKNSLVRSLESLMCRSV